MGPCNPPSPTPDMYMYIGCGGTTRRLSEARIGWHMTRTHNDGSTRAGRGDHHYNKIVTIASASASHRP